MFNLKVASGTKLILSKKKKKQRKKKKEDEHFDKVEMLHLGLSGVQCLMMASSPVSNSETHCNMK